LWLEVDAAFDLVLDAIAVLLRRELASVPSTQQQLLTTPQHA
jgi:hypothetical protein